MRSPIAFLLLITLCCASVSALSGVLHIKVGPWATSPCTKYSYPITYTPGVTTIDDLFHQAMGSSTLNNQKFGHSVDSSKFLTRVWFICDCPPNYYWDLYMMSTPPTSTPTSAPKRMNTLLTAGKPHILAWYH